MFNFSIGEIIVVGIVGLIVFGPERLPKLAQKLGFLISEIQNVTNQTKVNMTEQLKLEQLKCNIARAEAAELSSNEQTS